MKKFLFLLLAILQPIIASADDSGSCGDNVSYRYEEATQTLTIEGEGNMTNYNYSNFSPWDSYRSQIKYITIVEGITSIGNRCFYGCEHLISISLPNTLESIGESSFCGCSDLVTINIPISVSKIGSNAFTFCKSLKSISIPERTTVLEHSVLSECENIETINLHNSITTIGDWAFDNCKKLKDITIPSSVTSIGAGAFWCCENLSAIEIPNCVLTIGENAFGFCSGIKSIVIPERIEDIKDGTFNGCCNLSTVTIPRNVKSIGKGAFSRCNLLNDVYTSDLSAWCKIKFADYQSNPLYMAKHFYVDNKEITDLIIPEDITLINDYAFYSFECLTVTIPSTVESIGEKAFWGSLAESISIPNSVTTIGEGAFGMSSMKSVALSDNIKNISRKAFYHCSELATITIPSKVEIIYQEAFAECYKLNKVIVLPENPPTMYDDSFRWHNQTLVVPDGSIDLYKSMSPWSKFETIITISESQKHNLAYYVDDVLYKSYKLKVGDVITPEPAPLKEGYTFSGWSEIPETMPDHDVTITGSFCINKYNLTYKVDGEAYKSYDVEYGVFITPESAPTKEGYTFSGWSEIPATMPAHDVTVTGTFSINSYKLTYMIDDQVYKETMYDYGAAITPEPQPEGDYATFEWIDLPEKMPAHDVVVYASYTSGINEVMMTTQRNIRIYSPNGKKLDKMQKGLNIVILDDGTVKKVVMK